MTIPEEMMSDKAVRYGIGLLTQFDGLDSFDSHAKAVAMIRVGACRILAGGGLTGDRLTAALREAEDAVAGAIERHLPAVRR